MITCPLCEHAQPAGEECEVCGKPLAAGPPTAPIPALEGIERTRFESLGDGAVPLLEGLEPTHLGGVVVPTAPLDGLERTRIDPVVVATDPVPGLEPTVADAEVPGAASAPAAVVCRYCRMPASAGEALCGRCGMRLPIVLPLAVDPPPARCPVCGTATSGSRCPQCGGPARAEAS